MTGLRRLLLVVVVAEIVVGSGLVLRRMSDPEPPLPDLTDLDSLTQADLRRLRDQTVHGGADQWRTLAQAYLGQGYYEESEQCFRVAVRLAPEDQASVYGLGFCLERMGRLEEAVTVLERASGLSNDDLSRTCWYQIGRCHLRGEEVDKAEEAFRRIEDHPAGAYQLAKLLIRTGRASDAVPILDHRLSLNPESHKLMQLRAMAAELLGDDATARIYRDRVQRAPAGLEVEYGLSFILLFRSQYGLDRRLTGCSRQEQAGQLSQCADCLERVLEIIRREDLEQYDSVYMKAAEVAMAVQEPERAMSLLDELAALDLEDHRWLELRGDAHYLAGEPEAARVAWERSLLQSASGRVHRKLADWFDREGDPATAADHRGRAQQLDGIQAYYENRIEDAEQEFRRALEQEPDSARNWYYLGETQRVLGRPAEARDAYRHCLEIDPDYERARGGAALLDGVGP